MAMGGRKAALAAAIAVVMLVGVPFTPDAPSVDAKGAKALVPCPKKVGAYKLDSFDAFPEHDFQACDYIRPGKHGTVVLRAKWYRDIQGQRDRCGSRSPRLTEHHGSGDAWLLESPTRRVDGSIAFHRDPRVSLAKAEAALQRLISSSEPLSHTCVPPADTMPSDGLSCPLLMPGDLVRSDWYGGDPPAVVTMDDGAFQRYQLVCQYQSAYEDDDQTGFVWLEWYESDPGQTALCSAKTIEKRGSIKYWRGYHPVAVEVDLEFVARGGQALADTLEAAAAARTQRCPDAPEDPAPYEVAGTADAPGTTTTIVISGGPGEERPAVGSTIELPEDDQHQIVVGGPEGKVIREEFIGDQATVGAYGPLVTDADGSWSVLATVDVATAPAPTPLPSRLPSPAPATSPAPAATPTPSVSGPDATTTPAPPSPSPEPALASPAIASAQDPEPTASPTPIPPPELIGVPDGIAAIVAELPPAGAGAVRNMSDHVASLGEMLEEAERGEVTIPPSDIGSLRELLPDLVQEVWLTDGSIVVSTTKPAIGSILVKPVIGDDGLISVTLSRHQLATFHPVVRALVAALNGYVAERGGRFTSVSVTPEGLTVTAASSTQE